MNFTKKRIVITGASGFIGSHLFKRLISEEHAVLGIDCAEKGNIPEEGEFILGNILQVDWESVWKWEPEILIHLAETASVGKSFLDVYSEISNSLLGTSFILEKWKHRPSMKLLYFSSSAVYGNQILDNYHEGLNCVPISPYGICKFAAEQLIRIVAEMNVLNYVIVRPFSVYGPGLNKQVIYDLTCRFLKEKGKIIIAGTGKEQRDFVHIDDCCKIISGITDRIEHLSRITINIGNGRPVSLSKVISLIATLTDSGNNYEFAGVDLPGNPVNLVSDVTLLRSLNLSCNISIEEGLPGVISYIKGQLPVII